MEEKKKKLTGEQGELMRAFNISVDDLIANDGGYITDEQCENVPQRQAYQWKEYRNIALVLLLFNLAVPIITFFNFEEAPLVALLISIFLLSLASIFGTISFMRFRKIKKDLAKGTLRTAQGLAVVNLGGSQSYLEINGEKLHASPDVLRRVQHLKPYVIHYLPNSKVILSMERIDYGDANSYGYYPISKTSRAE